MSGQHSFDSHPGVTPDPPNKELRDLSMLSVLLVE